MIPPEQVAEIEAPRLFQRKPGTIEAVQWDGENWHECVMWAAGKARFGARNGVLTLLVDKDGVMGEQAVPVGHWLVCQPGDKSDIWPVGPDYFADKYEPAGALLDDRAALVAEVTRLRELLDNVPFEAWRRSTESGDAAATETVNEWWTARRGLVSARETATRAAALAVDP